MIQLQLENTSTCNAKCSFCVYPSAERWGGLMPLPLYRKILDEAETIDAITQVCITGLGEPLLDSALEARVRYARMKKPEALIDLFTNGVYLTPGIFHKLKDAGLSAIQVSLNAVTQIQHEMLMGLKDKFNIVCRNIDYAIENRGKLQVEVRAVVDGENFTIDDGLVFYARWGHANKRGHGRLIMEGNWAGDNRTTHDFKPNEACGRALSQIYVTWDGKVTTCCFDPTGKQVFGDLNHQTLREVYANPFYLQFRQDHSEDKADRYAICKDCTRI